MTTTNQLDHLTEEKEAHVLDLIEGHRTVEEIAALTGCSAGEVASWRALYVRGLRAGAATSRPRRKGRTKALGVLAAAATLAVIAYAGAVIAADGNCPNGMPFCFDPNTPAKASEVNENFDQLFEWLEQKVGTPGSATITLQPDADITGADIIEGHNDLRLSGQSGGGTDLEVTGAGDVNLAHSLDVSVNATVDGTLLANGNVNIAGALRGQGGPLDLGLVVRKCNTGAGTTDCWCNAGEVAISGGTHGTQINNHALRESRPIESGGNYGWRVACIDRDDGDSDNTWCGSAQGDDDIWVICAPFAMTGP